MSYSFFYPTYHVEASFVHWALSNNNTSVSECKTIKIPCSFQGKFYVMKLWDWRFVTSFQCYLIAGSFDRLGWVILYCFHCSEPKFVKLQQFDFLSMGMINICLLYNCWKIYWNKSSCFERSLALFSPTPPICILNCFVFWYLNPLWLSQHYLNFLVWKTIQNNLVNS